MSSKKISTTHKGLDSRHRQQRKMLLGKLKDGEECWWCGRPMYRDKQKNFDGLPLAADHIKARVHGGRLAERLLHYSCNSSRGDGSRDYMRPVVINEKIERDGVEVDAGFNFDGIELMGKLEDVS